MPGFIDDLVPDGVGANLITLTLRDNDQTLRAFSPIELLVKVTGEAVTNGLGFPLEMTVMGPGRKSFRRTLYERVVPASITFTPREGGVHIVRLAEVAHNQVWGTWKATINGERGS